MHGPRDAVLEIANCRRTDIARPDVGPGAAAFLGFASARTAFAARVGRQLEVPKVATVSIDPELRRSAFRLDDAGPAHAGHTTGCFEAWCHPGFEPAYGAGAFAYRIGKGPRPAAWISLATGCALRRIAGSHGKAGIVAACPIEADLGADCWTARYCKRDQ